MAKTENLDYPFYDVAETAQKMIDDGFTIHQKFTCEHCGNRLTIDEPNRFYTTGKCDKCNKITDIKRNGCNYLAISSRRSVEGV